MTVPSKLVRMHICNLGCIGADGLDIALDNIVCLVGANNSGKSTVLRAYECAVGMKQLSAEEIHCSHEDKIASVELWVHIPHGVANVDEKWKTPEGELLVVRSKWEWKCEGGKVEKPVRTTWDPEQGQYATDAKASGIDQVFGSRLPQPFRIGSLDGPESEHTELLRIVTDPIARKLKEQLETEGSPLHEAREELNLQARKPLEEYRDRIEMVQGQVGGSYCRVFSSSQIRLTIDVADLMTDPTKALQQASRIDIIETDNPASTATWKQQGTGSQRTLFWSILQVRSELDRQYRARDEAEKQMVKLKQELKRHCAKPPGSTPAAQASHQKKKQDLELAINNPASVDGSGFLPGHMLLIDEPETALHPAAVRAAKSHLYELARDAGWQVMLTTHHPAFVDPLEDHTTIVRLHRPDGNIVPSVYRADDVHFSGEEKDVLKSLMMFDSSVSEMFFGPHVVIVEGDTEYAAFSEVMEIRKKEYPDATRPLILRARGKSPIVTLAKMLTHFKSDFSVLHDTDAPKTTKGDKVNPAYTVNQNIVDVVAEARKEGLKVTHRVSTPGFEASHGMKLPKKDKPFGAWKTVRDDDAVQESVANLLAELAARPTETMSASDLDGRNYERLLKEWIEQSAATHPQYTFAEANPGV